MANLEVKSFDSPDEVREFEAKGKADVVDVGGRTIGRGTFEPGWKWSENVKPIAGTDTCEISHLGYMLHGRMRVIMDDGSEGEAGPGDVVAIHPDTTPRWSARRTASSSTSASLAITRSARSSRSPRSRSPRSSGLRERRR